MTLNPLNSSQEKLLKEIASGQYRDCYLVYNRKSTDDADNQKNSIKYQKAENSRFAYREHLPIAPITLPGFARDGIVSERHSGFKDSVELQFGTGNTIQYRIERPKFYRLVQWLSQGYFKGVIFLCWDRASRNKGDDTVIRKLMRAGVDVRFTLAHYDRSSAGELHMDIDGMFAEHHSRVTREKVTLTIQAKRSQGVCTHRAPVGYLNLGSMEHKPHDPQRAPIIAQLFELYATGEWSLADLTRWAIEQGFTMLPMRRRRTEEERLAEEEDDVLVHIEPVSRLPSPTTIHKILTNPFYAGQVLGNDGQYVTSVSHEGLVSEALFNEVQVELARKKRSVHYLKLLDHPLRGMVRCGSCQRLYTPYLQKGILYYGSRCAAGCPNPLKHCNFDTIAGRVEKHISSFFLTHDELTAIQASASTDMALLESRRFAQLEEDERKKKKLREDLAYLNTNRLNLLKTGAYSPEGIVAEERRLNRELASLQQREQASDTAMRETVRDAVRLSELLKHLTLYYSNGNPQEKDETIRLLFSELTLNGNTLDYQCTVGFRPLAMRFTSMGDLTTWLSELPQHRECMAQAIVRLEFILDKYKSARDRGDQQMISRVP